MEKNDVLLTLDYNHLVAEVLGPEIGLTSADLSEVKKSLAKAVKDFEARRREGLLPFADLPQDAALPKTCRKLAAEVRKKFDDALVLGIGGSALGPSAVFTALRPLNHNALPADKRGWPRLHVADNVDPEGFGALLDGLDPSKTFVNVISKSGATAETMSQFMIVADRFQKALGPEGFKERLLVTTDPQNGVLRRLVEENGWTALPIPPGVGGRFSVLTAVGLAPLALAGVDVAGLLTGARRAQEAFDRTGAASQAALFAGLNWLLTVKKGRGSLVMMPYADALGRVADWFGQLWNESLGKAKKLDGSPAGAGQTSIKALGATDQHSQLQLYMEGPQDKTICFLGTEAFRAKLSIPKIFKKFNELGYLGGHSLGELLNNERLGTAKALAESGRPNFSLTMPKVGPETVGFLLQTLMLATVLSGTLYGVDPLDQPGVELGKKFTYGLMGRAGFEEMTERYDRLKPSKKFMVESSPLG
ncbi:MAG: glucose-6-phosphate isomerase [Deltaproteobacteria bacterium]|jgi:glucose-6-phosphate isomerase|nr:glucose-6-phosphate isomerase [Deltaproteobacteria bacterium]